MKYALVTCCCFVLAAFVKSGIYSFAYLAVGFACFFRMLNSDDNSK